MSKFNYLEKENVEPNTLIPCRKREKISKISKISKNFIKISTGKALERKFSRMSTARVVSIASRRGLYQEWNQKIDSVSGREIKMGKTYETGEVIRRLTEAAGLLETAEAANGRAKTWEERLILGTEITEVK